MAEWNAKCEAADKALRAGSWEEGRAAADGLIAQILARPAQGLDTLLARDVAYRAIFEPRQVGRALQQHAQLDAAHPACRTEIEKPANTRMELTKQANRRI